MPLVSGDDKPNIEGPGGTLIDPISEIIAYVMNTPGNTNPAILREMIQALTNSTTSSESISELEPGDDISKD